MLRTVRGSIIISIFVSMSIAVSAMILFAIPTDAAINNQINFQGKITNPNGTNVTNGSYAFVFSIYTVASGGSNVWTESKNLTVTDGIFQTALGDTTSLPGSVDFNSSSLYLGIRVGADAEMTPRVRLTAAPYSFNSDLLDGLDSNNFVKLAQGLQVDASTTNSSIAVNKTGGTAGIMQLQRAGSDVLNIANTGAYTYTLSATDNPAYVVTNNGSSNVVTNLAGTGDVIFQDNGSAFFTLTDNGSLDYTLDVTDNPTFTITNNGSGNVTYNLNGTGDFIIQDSGVATLTITETGATIFKNSADSATAFLIQKAGSTVDLLTIDSANDRVYIGDVTADATGTLLVLDTKNNAGDPTGVNGAMYYNSSSNRFRCFQNSVWRDCLGKETIFLTADDTNNNGTANTLEDVVGMTFPVISGNTYVFECKMWFTSAAATTGSRWTINGPTTSSLSYSSYYPANATTTADAYNYALAAYNLPAGSSAASPTAGAQAVISGRATFTASGNVQVRFASEIAGSAIVAKVGSTCEYSVQ